MIATYDLQLMTKTIYIVRHGQTDFNIKQVVQGRGVNSDLNETGHKQAKFLYDHYRHVPFDVVYTSKLKRTHQTMADFISDEIAHEVRDSLDEIDWGIFEGVEHHADLQKTYYDIISSWKNGDLTIKIEGGESAQDLKDRLLPFVQELKESSAQNILICTHGRTLRVLMCLLLGKPVTQMDDFSHDNTCVYKLQYDGNNFQLEMENDLTHLSLRNPVNS
jgi:probable phosphoglycerate mutase